MGYRELKNIENHVEYLRASQLYYIMGHANELNFSDWLEWLFTYRKDCLNNVFNLLFNKEFQFDNKILRESKHIDLIIKTKKINKIIIENKVKNVQMPMQLKRYTQGNVGYRDTCIMLSLTKPVFFENNKFVIEKKYKNKTRKIEWIYLSYRDLIEKIDEQLKKEKDDLINDRIYIEVKENVKALCNIVEQFKFGFNTEKMESIIETEFSNKLNEIKLRPLYEKYFYGNFMYEVYKNLVQKNIKTTISNEWRESSEGDVLCWSDFSFTGKTGLADFKFILNSNNEIVVLGVQIQGKEIRKFIEVSTGNAENIAQKLEKSWFNADGYKNKFQHYGSKFAYKCKDVSDSTVNDVINETINSLMYLVKNFKNLKSYLN